MSAYCELIPLLRELVCLWAMLLCTGFLVNAVIAYHQKRHAYVFASAAGLLVPYLMINVRMEMYVHRADGMMHPLAKYAAGLPVRIYLAVLFLFTVIFLLRFHRALRYGRTHITPSSVKEAADELPTGLCYYHENGQPFLTNHKMNELSVALTGHLLLDGREFWAAVPPDGVLRMDDGTIYHLRRRQVRVDGEPFFELLADDVTEFYRKTDRLSEDNMRLREQNLRLRNYGRTIDDMVRREEILRTKTNIHNEMNRLLLATEKAVRSGTAEERAEILEIWQKNVLLLCVEAAPEPKNNVLTDLDTLAKILGITLVYDVMPRTTDVSTLKLFTLGAEEAMTNAAKHAEASHLYIHLEENDRVLRAEFTNDGLLPAGELREGGGLSELRRRIEEVGGEMHVTSGEEYQLSIIIPKGGTQNVL